MAGLPDWGCANPTKVVFGEWSFQRFGAKPPKKDKVPGGGFWDAKFRQIGFCAGEARLDFFLN